MDAGKERRKRNWPAIFEEQRRSGWTAARYCRERGIRYKAFLYQRRKARTAGVEKRSDHHTEVQSPSFIPISIPRLSSIRITLAKGVVLESDRMPDVDWLVELASKLPFSGSVPC